MTCTTSMFAFLTLAMAAGAVQADELSDELLVCRDLPSDEVRLFCYDSAVDRSRQRGSRPAPATETPPPPAAVTTTAASGAAAEISQEDLFGKTTVEVQRTVEEVTGDERIESLNGRITRLQQAGYDKVVITLDNDQIWLQIDSSSLRLKVGDSVRIERASLGSFLLKKDGSKRTMRVKRRD